PFLHLDEMGAVEYAPGEPKGTPWHPHRGFETVTYLLDGAFDHRDSHGGGGRISDGDTQWMTAGSGLLHIEAPPEELVVSGGLFHGIQLWVNLPRSAKWAPPRYQDVRGDKAQLVASADAGALLRIIAGEVAGQSGPGVTHTPISMVHATIAPGANLTLPWPSQYNALVYALSGQGHIGPTAHRLPAGHLAVLGDGDFLSISGQERPRSAAPQLEVLILGGQPIAEAIAWAGPFVMNTRREVLQAFADFQAGRLGQIPQ
ncbi:MAG: pirin family protein, partial [Angustibacter sp.]